MIEIRVNEPDEKHNYKRRVGAYGILKNDNEKIAVVQTSTGFFLPGGGVEIGENYGECLEREFIEEVGFKVRVKDKFSIISYFFYSTTMNIYLESKGHFYECEFIEKITDDTEEDHSLVWLSYEEAIEKLYLMNQKHAIEIYNNINI